MYCVGMGCERGCPQSHLEALLHTCLKQAGISIDDVHSINSLDLKADEIGLLALAQSLQKPFQTWSAEVLRPLTSRLHSPSQYVFNTVGVYGVAESSALYAADKLLASVLHGENASNPRSELIVTKQKTAKATCAIAVALLR